MKKIIILIAAMVIAPLAQAHHHEYNEWGHHEHHHHHYRQGYPEVRYYQAAPPVVYAPQPTFQLQYTPPVYNVQPANPYYQQPVQPNYNSRSHW